MNTNREQNQCNNCGYQDDVGQAVSVQDFQDYCPDTGEEAAEGMCGVGESGMNMQQPMSGFTVTLRGNGGFFGSGQGTPELRIPMFHPTTIQNANLPIPTPQRRFHRWSRYPTGPQFLPPNMPLDGNITLYARFEYEQMSRAALADEILRRHNGTSLDGRRIVLRTPSHGSMTDAARTTTFMNIVDTARGLGAARPPAGGGGTVLLREDLLRMILLINDRFGTITLNSLSGGVHGSSDSHHYRGRAVDIQVSDCTFCTSIPRTNVATGSLSPMTNRGATFAEITNHLSVNPAFGRPDGTRGTTYCGRTHGYGGFFHIQVVN